MDQRSKAFEWDDSFLIMAWYTSARDQRHDQSDTELQASTALEIDRQVE